MNVSDSVGEALARCEVSAGEVRDVDAFKNWMRTGVRGVLPHALCACVHGRLYGVGMSPDYVVGVDFPIEHLFAIRNASGHMDTPLAARWYTQQKPVFFDERAPWPGLPQTWLDSFHEHGLCNAAADGMLDRANCVATYFSFHRLPTLNETMLGQIFEVLTPLLHETFSRVIHRYEAQAHACNRYSKLSAREREIAGYLAHGQSNGEIAQLLAVSEHTVRNHISRMLDKTGCRNRTGLARLVAQQVSLRQEIGANVL